MSYADYLVIFATDSSYNLPLASLRFCRHALQVSPTLQPSYPYISSKKFYGSFHILPNQSRSSDHHSRSKPSVLIPSLHTNLLFNLPPPLNPLSFPQNPSAFFNAPVNSFHNRILPISLWLSSPTLDVPSKSLLTSIPNVIHSSSFHQPHHIISNGVQHSFDAMTKYQQWLQWADVTPLSISHIILYSMARNIPLTQRQNTNTGWNGWCYTVTRRITYPSTLIHDGVMLRICTDLKAGSTRCVVHICGASCVNVSKRFVKSDTYSSLWCVNLPPNWRTRCDEWTNDTSTQVRHIFSYTRCANHDAWHITNTNHASCGPSLILIHLTKYRRMELDVWCNHRYRIAECRRR